jgi:hypothetical protein
MSWDDKRFMAEGRRVRHRYKKRRGCHSVCVRCSVKRRYRFGDFEYLLPRLLIADTDIWVTGIWVAANPACTFRSSRLRKRLPARRGAK